MLVDILSPTNFIRTGVTKDISDAWRAGDWLGSFNLWIVQREAGIDHLIYQQRTSNAMWAPNLLDVAAGGHYEAGENTPDGVREAREELGRAYEFQDLTYLGKKLYLRDDGWKKLRYAVDVCIVMDPTPLSAYHLQREEIDALYHCAIDDLIRAHEDPDYSFIAEGVGFDGEASVSLDRTVSAKSFPFNWDSYHYKMALLARRFVRGETGLIY